MGAEVQIQNTREERTQQDQTQITMEVDKPYTVRWWVDLSMF